VPITENAPIQRYQSGELRAIEDTLVTEANVALELDGAELIRVTCSPDRLREWVIGYLFSEGRIAGPENVAEIHQADGRFSVELSASAPAELEPLTPVGGEFVADPKQILSVAREVIETATVFKQTGGTHAMAIAAEDGVVALAEDISRTCALEKALGVALGQGVDFGRSIAFLSSRIPARMIAKLARCGVPIVTAVSAPTIDAVRLAEELNVCLCGFVRGERLNVYAHGWRIGL